MKVFGIGLPRTGTTSLSAALLELGFRTCHRCFRDALYDAADAFLDTPVYADYPALDARFPGSRFVLTWRDPDAWYDSLTRTLGNYLRVLRTQAKPNHVDRVNRRCFTHVFGALDPDRAAYTARFREHRAAAEAHFAARPADLLVLDPDAEADPWAPLCAFLGRARPAAPYPRLNADRSVNAWSQIAHDNKVVG